MFDINILCTGSSGNCSIVDKHIMIDCGIKKSKFIELFDELDALFITHRHSDHMSVPILNWLYTKHYEWFLDHVYMNQDTINAFTSSSKVIFTLPLQRMHILEQNQKGVFATRTSQYAFETFPLSHDVENQGFIFTNVHDKSLVWATDTRTLEHCPHRKFDVICCEGNYDEDKLYIDLVSDDFATQFRATRNLRHLSVQAFENFVHEHSHKNTQVYQLHESHDFGVMSQEAINGKTSDCSQNANQKES